MSKLQITNGSIISFYFPLVGPPVAYAGVGVRNSGPNNNRHPIVAPTPINPVISVIINTLDGSDPHDGSVITLGISSSLFFTHRSNDSYVSVDQPFGPPFVNQRNWTVKKITNTGNSNLFDTDQIILTNLDSNTLMGYDPRADPTLGNVLGNVPISNGATNFTTIGVVNINSLQSMCCIGAIPSSLCNFPCPTPSPSPTPSPGPGPSPTPTPSPGPGPSPSPTPSPGPGPSPTPSPGPGPSPTPTPTPGPGPGPTPTPGPGPGPSPTPTIRPTPPPPRPPNNDALWWILGGILGFLILIGLIFLIIKLTRRK